MRPIRTALFAGAALLAVAGSVGIARAESAPPHVMTVQLPNGAVEQVRYYGNVPPVVVMTPDQALSPVALFGADPFAMLDRMAAEMDRQAATMLQQADALAMMPMTGPGGLTEAALGGSGVCVRSVEITALGNGQAPKVVSRSAGNCGGAGAVPQGAAPATLPTMPAPEHLPDVVKAKAVTPYRNMVHDATDWHG